MKILSLNWLDLKNPDSGGAEVHLEELLRRLVKMGHSVTLFCSGYKGCKSEEIIEGVRIIRQGSRYNFNFVAPLHLRKLTREENFDILIEDINKIPFYTPLYLSIPTLVVVPHLFATSVFQEINFFLGSYIYLAELPLPRVYKGRKFNVISESTESDLRKRGIPEADVSVVHCGIDSDLYCHDAEVKKYDTPTILYVGRLKKYKSVQHLIRALINVRKTIPDARLVVVGAGDYQSELKDLAEKLGLSENVDFAGFLTQADKVERIRKSHVCVCPSSKEGWGLTNIEANACGTAVIASNVEGLKDSVRHDETGLLYSYGDISELSSLLCKVLSDKTLRGRLEKGGLRWAERFNWDNAAGEFMKVVESALKAYNSVRK